MREFESVNCKKLLMIFAALALVTVSTACGNVKTTPAVLGGSNVDEPAEVDMSEIHSKLDAMEVEVFNVSQEMAELDLQNPLNLLGDGLKDSVGRFSGVIKDLKVKIEELKIKLNSQLANLDSSDPKQQEIIAKLNGVLGQLDEVSTYLDTVVNKIEQKIDTLFAKLKKKVDDRLSGIQAILAKLAVDKLRESVLGRLIG